MSFDLSDDDWADFISLTDLVYDGFSQRLLEQYPKLGKWDVRICCLSKNGFSNQVISILLDTQTESYYKRKTRIKQMKMDLSSLSGSRDSNKAEHLIDLSSLLGGREIGEMEVDDLKDLISDILC